MRVWIDLANSPHVPLFVPVVRAAARGGARGAADGSRPRADAAAGARGAGRTLSRHRRREPGRPRAQGGCDRLARAGAAALRASTTEPDVALSHGSYAQIVAARLARIPAVTMMDYEHQPANHLSFRLARRVIVPAVFPEAALRRFGARDGKVVRYDGFKEELYLSERNGRRTVLDELGLDRVDGRRRVAPAAGRCALPPRRERPLRGAARRSRSAAPTSRSSCCRAAPSSSAVRQPAGDRSRASAGRRHRSPRRRPTSSSAAAAR